VGSRPSADCCLFTDRSGSIPTSVSVEVVKGVAPQADGGQQFRNVTAALTPSGGASELGLLRQCRTSAKTKFDELKAVGSQLGAQLSASGARGLIDSVWDGADSAESFLKIAQLLSGATKAEWAGQDCAWSAACLIARLLILNPTGGGAKEEQPGPANNWHALLRTMLLASVIHADPPALAAKLSRLKLPGGGTYEMYEYRRCSSAATRALVGPH
jgi:hypothetical protein